MYRVFEVVVRQTRMELAASTEMALFDPVYLDAARSETVSSNTVVLPETL
jgi:hypothetical protein